MTGREQDRSLGRGHQAGLMAVKEGAGSFGGTCSSG